MNSYTKHCIIKCIGQLLHAAAKIRLRRGAILFRKILKLAAVLAVCLIILVVGVLVNLAGILFPRQRSRACAQVQQMWARMMCCALGMSILSRDAHEQTADGRGMFVVSNHISYLDIIVLAAVFPAAFLSKQEVRRWPLFGWLASLCRDGLCRPGGKALCPCRHGRH